MRNRENTRRRCLTPSRLAPGLLALGLVMSVPRVAKADLAPSGTLAIGVERLFGIVTTNTDTEGVDDDRTSFSLLWAGPPGGGAPQSPYNRPRVAIDYFVIDSLSLGGSLGFYTWSEEEDDGDTEEGDGLLFAPRIGYMIDISDDVGFWPRGGFTFVRDDFDGPNITDTATALTVEAPLIIRVADPVALNIGLNLDLGLTGERENDGPGGIDIDQEHDEFGLQFGVLGLF